MYGARAIYGKVAVIVNPHTGTGTATTMRRSKHPAANGAEQTDGYSSPSSKFSSQHKPAPSRLLSRCHGSRLCEQNSKRIAMRFAGTKGQMAASVKWSTRPLVSLRRRSPPWQSQHSHVASQQISFPAVPLMLACARHGRAFKGLWPLMALLAASVAAGQSGEI